MSKASFWYYLQNYNFPWTCLFCSMAKLSDSFFDELNGEDFDQPASAELPEGNVAVIDYLALTASKLALAPKDLPVANLNPLTPVPPIAAHAKTYPQFPVLPVTARKKDMGTIAFPTLPEDCLDLLLFYCS